ncbi:MAG: P1 family peptidase [Clostridia bacterium]|jgi:L-aminopeptidase/D-esterase-like protein|nr:P1 family peptidase [Clostridia bacterium]
MREVPFLSIDGIRCGHAQDLENGTGCTVVLCEEGATAGVDVRGGSPGTRETDLLDPANLVEQVHGVFLAGGSAFGLNAAAGIMKYLEERGAGFDVTVARVPIVTGAVLFDLVAGSPHVRPDEKMGYEACVNAKGKGEILEEGCVGAGTGATVGKYLGPQYAMKGGLGTAAYQVGDLIVGAVTAVNCLGDVVDPATGKIIAGMLDQDRKNITGTEKALLAAAEKAERTNLFKGNTTIGIVVTNAKLTKAQAKKIASMAHDGFARSIIPSHTFVDGDTIFVLGTGEVEADLNALGLLAAKAVAKSVVSGVTKARSMYGFPAATDL